jgi:hypothetical protein
MPTGFAWHPAFERLLLDTAVIAGTGLQNSTSSTGGVIVWNTFAGVGPQTTVLGLNRSSTMTGVFSWKTHLQHNQRKPVKYWIHQAPPKPQLMGHTMVHYVEGCAMVHCAMSSLDRLRKDILDLKLSSNTNLLNTNG